MDPKIKTTVVGSYPVPDWLAALPSEQALIDATSVVFKVQENAGVDVIADGELYRFDINHPDTNGMIDYFVKPLSGVRSDLTLSELRMFRADEQMAFRSKPAGVVIGEIKEGALNLPDDFRRARALTHFPMKFTVTGPHMLCKTLVDLHYESRRDLCMAIAQVLADQVSEIDAEVVQIDEANLTGHPEDADWALECINVVLEAVPTTPAVHLCFGNYGGQSIQKGDWGKLIDFLSGLHCDHVLLEVAHRGNWELERLAEINPEVKLGFGVVDVKTNVVETPEEIARKLEEATRVLGEGRIGYINPDCGFWMLKRSVADRKIRALVAGRDLFEGKTMKVGVNSIEFFIRNVRTRLPFKYGNAVLTATPVLHVRMEVHDGEGHTTFGYSADCLPPKWFDKDPEKDFKRNVEDLLLAADCGKRAYLDIGQSPEFFFDFWLKAYSKTIESSGVHQILNGLTGSFGASLMERALLDGFSKLQGTHLFECIRGRTLRIQPEKVHSRLHTWSFSDSLPEAPLGQIAVRHTVGLADPIRDADIPKEEALDDGLPQSLEAWARDFGIRYFKIKVTNDLSVDIPRLQAIASTLDASAPSDYKITLDGNETFKAVDGLENWHRKVRAEKSLESFLKRVIYLEQPIDRLSAFDASVASHLKEAKDLPPVIIDESDDSLGTFNMAAEYGYRGVSFKNCKGAIKGLLNKMLVDAFNSSEQGEYFLTGEDLMNTSVVPVQQDLAMASILGLAHVERNGHHYCRGLDHLSKKEIDACLSQHPNLYEPFGESGRLKIQDGFLDVSSLHTQGFGAVMEPDFDFMTPVGEWRFEDLEG